MPSYALLLRGVNIGTRNSLPMADLRAMLEKLGCGDVRTYVQSGNAVFGTKLSPSRLTAAIEGELERYMGRPIATTLRTEKQLQDIIAGNPFASIATNPSRLCVTFLSHQPKVAELAALHANDWQPELFKVAGTEIYTWYPNGQGTSPLAKQLGRLRLRGAVTTRNWNTVLKLSEMLGET
ncbi:MAG TPA: DUF1697 domain-containing protein [Gemmatimonadales bacterium]|nr:DUF1697 domain-containing protein [Gemmatimonadales bacterium]